MNRPPGPPTLRSTILAAILAGLAAACGTERPATGPELQVAVAANFAATARILARDFEASTGVPVRLAVGSTGALYAQIVNGAPYHVLLAADQERPRRLEEAGLAEPGSRFTYAAGRLVAYAPGRGDEWSLPGILREPGVRVAWADPRTAPYGAAARAALEAWGLGGLEGAVGESVGHAYQFARSGAVDVAFVSLSQVQEVPPGEVRPVDSSLAPPVLQDAVLLGEGMHGTAAREFLDFLRGPEARALIEAAGYEVPRGGGDGE